MSDKSQTTAHDKRLDELVVGGDAMARAIRMMLTAQPARMSEAAAEAEAALSLWPETINRVYRSAARYE